MDNEFLKVDLLPGYKEDKFVSHIIYRIVFAIAVLFLAFYYMFLPYYNAKMELESYEFENTQLFLTQAVYTSRLGEIQPEEINVIYQETISFIEEESFPLNNWIGQLLLIDVDGYKLYDMTFSMELEEVSLYALFESDKALLEFEEQLWGIYWVQDVVIKEGGPGEQTITVSFMVGDDLEE